MYNFLMDLPYIIIGFFTVAAIVVQVYIAKHDDKDV